MKIYKDEIFGPVLSVMRAPDVATATRLINAHEYGNGVALFTNDGGVARDFTQGDPGRDGGDQCADPGADGVPLVWRLEALAVRRSPYLRAGGRTVLHPLQGGDAAVGRRGRDGGRRFTMADAGAGSG